MTDAPGTPGASGAEPALVLAPTGRDARIAAALLAQAGVDCVACDGVADLVGRLAEGAALALVAQEALRHADLAPLSAWLAAQPAWSDLPFVVMTSPGGPVQRDPQAAGLMERLGNVTLLERPFHPSTLVSVVRTALRSRHRQHQARAQLEQLSRQRSELAEGQARFRTLADNIPVLTWTADADGSIHWYNSRWYEYTGTTPEQMAGWGWQSVHDPDCLPDVLDRWKRSIVTQTPFEMVFPLRGADGIFRPFLTRVAPLRDGAGTLVAWFGTNVDISAERAAEAAVRDSEERLRFALEAGRLGAWEIDLATDELRCSDLAKACFGYAPDQPFTHADLRRAVHTDDSAQLIAARARAARELSDYAQEYRVVWPDGSVHWVEVRGRPMPGPHGGQAVRMAGVAQDITERKSAEAELQTYRAHLEQLVAARTRDLSDALARLNAEVLERERTEEVLRQSQKMEAIGQLTGGIAHDFNNLLTGIAGSLELIETRVRQGRPGDIARYLSIAGESVRRAASLTHRLLAFARRQTLERKPVAVNQLVHGMLDLIRGTIGPAIALDLDLEDSVAMTLCDANQLENALLNLCLNARDAMPGGGRLTIATREATLGENGIPALQGAPPGPYVMLSVSDSGVGMSAETLARAFDPFFTTKAIGEGTGLGLSMVYGFVRQSDGQVGLESSPGQGTTVRLFLPRHDSQGEATAQDAGDEPATGGGHAGRTVLVVEDEGAIRDMIVELLSEHGLHVLDACDGPAGLRIVETTGPIDLLLTDVGLPGMSGRQLADRARALRPGLKTLFITGYAPEFATGERALDDDMHIVTKPFTMDGLMARVRGMLEPT